MRTRNHRQEPWPGCHVIVTNLNYRDHYDRRCTVLSTCCAGGFTDYHVENPDGWVTTMYRSDFEIIPHVTSVGVAS